MSRLIVRGGYGEHGRSCFLVEYGEAGRMYMVDCGIMDTDSSPYPNVSPEELDRVDYLFLTHCHKDHSGAFEYFCEHGFRGKLVTTGMTCRLAGIVYEDTELLLPESKTDAGKFLNIRQFGALAVRYGRTGHCPGGLWFEIFDGDKTFFFSGDYQEHALVYACDPLRDSNADVALIDCAHHQTEKNAEELRGQLVAAVREKLRGGRPVILPVPQYGRGLEILYLMWKTFPDLRICVDKDFVIYAEKMLMESAWYNNDAYQLFRAQTMNMLDVEEEDCGYDILILADTHLKKKKNMDFVHRAIEKGASVLINGRVKKNGPVEKLLDFGKAERFLFPHHQSRGDLLHVIEKNHFQAVLPFHNEEKEVLV
ncbi:MAG: MBL fold metallo-hydrolase [Lachnospiraceae bacterium]|nr:MBL fold metallo-hydrolase [Lachnospiraceae bacterium]MBQ6857246.1 MBL fold metallo-hydrolase [Lachnospiraceae bacterium]